MQLQAAYTKDINNPKGRWDTRCLECPILVLLISLAYTLRYHMPRHIKKIPQPMNIEIDTTLYADNVKNTCRASICARSAHARIYYVARLEPAASQKLHAHGLTHFELGLTNYNFSSQ
jgi:hypothetical protein